GILPGAGHDYPETDDPARHDIPAAKGRQLLILEFDRFERLCLGRQAGGQAGDGQPVWSLHWMLPELRAPLPLEEVALDESEIHQLCVLHRAEGVDAVLGGQWHRWFAQDVGLVVALAYDGEDDAVPAFDEI